MGDLEDFHNFKRLQANPPLKMLSTQLEKYNYKSSRVIITLMRELKLVLSHFSPKIVVSLGFFLMAFRKKNSVVLFSIDVEKITILTIFSRGK